MWRWEIRKRKERQKERIEGKKLVDREEEREKLE